MGRVENRRDQALRYVNEIRASRGCEPLEALLPGFKSNACACPITNSVREAFPIGSVISTYDMLHAVIYHAHWSEQLLADKVPSEVFKFIKDFDAGSHPDLVKDTDD